MYLFIELGIEDVDIIVADVSDQDSIETMCGRTRVIIDVVGPVRKCLCIYYVLSIHFSIFCMENQLSKPVLINIVIMLTSLESLWLDDIIITSLILLLKIVY